MALGEIQLAHDREPDPLVPAHVLRLRRLEIGGGTGLVGIPKAFDELRALGWVTGRTRFVAVQAEGCAPLVRAWEEKAETTTPVERPFTNAPGLRVPGPFAGRQMLRILRDTGGLAMAVSEQAIVDAQRLMAKVEGIWTAPEAAATLAALIRLKEEGEITASTRVALILTGAGIKYEPPSSPPPLHLEGSREQIAARLKDSIRAPLP